MRCWISATWSSACSAELDGRSASEPRRRPTDPREPAISSRGSAASSLAVHARFRAMKVACEELFAASPQASGSGSALDAHNLNDLVDPGHRHQQGEQCQNSKQDLTRFAIRSRESIRCAHTIIPLRQQIPWRPAGAAVLHAPRVARERVERLQRERVLQPGDAVARSELLPDIRGRRSNAPARSRADDSAECGADEVRHAAALVDLAHERRDVDAAVRLGGQVEVVGSELRVRVEEGEEEVWLAYSGATAVRRYRRGEECVAAVPGAR